MEENGDFVLYAGDETLWRVETNETGYVIYMNDNGDLVFNNSIGSQLSISKTDRTGEYLVCQNDGNLVIFNKKKEIKWSSNTTQSNFLSIN